MAYFTHFLDSLATAACCRDPAETVDLDSDVDQAESAGQSDGAERPDPVGVWTDDLAPGRFGRRSFGVQAGDSLAPPSTPVGPDKKEPGTETSSLWADAVRLIGSWSDDAGETAAERRRSKELHLEQALKKFDEVMTGDGLRVLKHSGQDGSKSNQMRVLKLNYRGNELTWKATTGGMFAETGRASLTSIFQVELDASARMVWLSGSPDKRLVGFETEEAVDACVLHNCLERRVAERHQKKNQAGTAPRT